jgi:hypothetical protein
MIEANVAHIDDAVTTMRRCMDEASRIVLAGVIVSTSYKLVHPGQRYVDEDRPAAIRMWDRVLRQLDAIERDRLTVTKHPHQRWADTSRMTGYAIIDDGYHPQR